MIAPIRPSSPDGPSASELAPARRAVADLLLPNESKSAGPPVAHWAAYLFLGWAAAVVTAYLLRGAWWGRGS